MKIHKEVFDTETELMTSCYNLDIITDSGKTCRISNRIWYSMGREYSGCRETGVRDLSIPGSASFRLIQHNWNFDKSDDFITKALNKDWNLSRIENLMYWMNNRGR